MKTPIGSIKAVFTFSEKDGALTGIAVGGDGTPVTTTDIRTSNSGASHAGRLPDTKMTAICLSF